MICLLETWQINRLLQDSRLEHFERKKTRTLHSLRKRINKVCLDP